VDASGSTGGVVFTQTNAGTFTFTGGSADDTIIMGSTYTSADTIDGAGGSDTLGGTTAVIGGTTSSQTKVSNIEKLRVSDAHTTAINVSHFGSITDVILDVGSNAGSVTNASSGINVSMGTKAGTSAGGGTFALTVSGSGTTDSATCTLNDAEQSGSVTFTGVETLNLVSNLDLDGSAADTGTAGTNRFAGTLVLTDTAATEKVVVTGTESMTITGAVTANEVDASGATEPLIMGAACTISGVTVTGGAGGDTLFGSAGNDIINGGAGADTINPLAGNDIVSGGAGADIFRQSAAAANGVDRQTISDFDDTVTTGDIFNFNSGVATLTGTNNFASSAAIQTHSTTGNLTVNAAAEVVLVTSATVTDLTSANSLNGTNLLTAVGGTITGAIVGQNDILICVADTNGNVGVYHASSANNAILNTEITLVAVLQGSNVTLANLVFNNFTNGA
ncbi:MAG: beta strand repeat-containing protein, partial [Phycisphaerae bacterium]